MEANDKLKQRHKVVLDDKIHTTIMNDNHPLVQLSKMEYIKKGSELKYVRALK